MMIQPKDNDSSHVVIDTIIDINLKEVTAIYEILSELQIRFPDKKADLLRSHIQERIKNQAQAGSIKFFMRTSAPSSTMNVTAKQGIELMTLPVTWLENPGGHLVAAKIS